MTFPPEPWDLRGDLHVATLLVPEPEIPLDLPADLVPVRLGRNAVVGLAWVDYRPGSVLTYRELMATVLVRRGRHVYPHVAAIWVDSPESRDGGRALWGIPKELAEFEVSGTRWSATTGTGPIATARITPRRALPGRMPVRFAVAQELSGATKVSPVRAKAGVVVERMELDVEPTGPLGFLAGRTPHLATGFRDFRMTFGTPGPSAAGGLATSSVQWGR